MALLRLVSIGAKQRLGNSAHRNHPQLSGIFNVASGENVSNGELAEVFERCGWSVSLARDTPRQSAPLCASDRLRGLGVTPAPVRQVIERQLKREGFLAAG